jgi:hypothetical protein
MLTTRALFYIQNLLLLFAYIVQQNFLKTDLFQSNPTNLGGQNGASAGRGTSGGPDCRREDPLGQRQTHVLQQGHQQDFFRRHRESRFRRGLGRLPLRIRYGVVSVSIVRQSR